MTNSDCPKCGQPFELSQSTANARVECPHCGSKLKLNGFATSPEPLAPESLAALRLGSADADDYQLAPLSADEGARRESASSIPGLTFSLREADKRPTKPRSTPPRVAPKRGSTRLGRLVAVFRGPYSVILCAGLGLLLGAVLAVLLGTIFGEGNSFEVGVYIVSGLIFGLFVGAITGCFLMPRDLSAYESEQRDAGLTRLMTGMILVVFGLVGFAIFNEIEKGGDGPERLPRIVVLVYMLTGKWENPDLPPLSTTGNRRAIPLGRVAFCIAAL